MQGPIRTCKKCGCRCHCYDNFCPNCVNDVCGTCDCKNEKEE